MRNTVNPALYNTKPKKNYEKFKTLLPRDGFCTLKPDDFKEMLKIIHNEPDKNLKNYYFSEILDRMFANGWGWYMRLGESLSTMPRYKYASELPEAKRADALKVLRMVKDMHIELHYKPNYMVMINKFIQEFGGTLLSREEKAKQRAAQFIRAKTALDAGQKVPRKLKKTVLTRMAQNQK